jgi:hypothetical protein
MRQTAPSPSRRDHFHLFRTARRTLLGAAGLPAELAQAFTGTCGASGRSPKIEGLAAKQTVTPKATRTLQALVYNCRRCHPIGTRRQDLRILAVAL